MTTAAAGWTDAQVDAQTLEDIRSGRVPTRLVDEAGPGIRLWDNVEGAWTKPLPPQQAQLYSRKVVFKCRACNWTSTHPGQVATHIQEAATKTAEHRRARLHREVQGAETVEVCSGCGSLFRVGKGAGRKHLELMQGMAALHKDAAEDTILRFSLSPPAGMPTSLKGPSTAVRSNAGGRPTGT